MSKVSGFAGSDCDFIFPCCVHILYQISTLRNQRMPTGQVEGKESKPEDKTAHQVCNALGPAGETPVHVFTPSLPRG